MTLQQRVEKLKAKYLKPIELTADIGKGFNEAYDKPGYGPVTEYMDAVFNAGRMPELLDGAYTTGRMGRVLDGANDEQKKNLCDLARV